MVHRPRLHSSSSSPVLKSPLLESYSSSRDRSVSNASPLRVSSSPLDKLLKYLRRSPISPVPFKLDDNNNNIIIDSSDSFSLPPPLELERSASGCWQMLMDTGILCTVYGFLDLKDVLRCRGVNRKWYKSSHEQRHFQHQICMPKSLPNIPHTSIRHIRTLDLSRSQLLTDQIITYCIISLKYLHTLKLNGHWNQVSPDGIAQLQNMQRLKNLEIESGVTLDNNGLKALSLCKQVQSLKITGNMQLWTEDGIRHLGRMGTQLESLSLCSNTFNTRLNCMHLTGLTGLRVLELIRFDLSARDLTFLAQLTSLQSLTLSQNHTLTDSGFAALNHLPELSTLRLSHCVSISDGAIMALNGAVLGQLKALIIHECRIGDMALKHLTENGGEDLQVLELNHCPVSDTGLSYARHMTSLVRLSVVGCPEVRGHTLSDLSQNRDLRIIDLSHSGVMDSGIRQVATLTQIRTLVCAGLKLTDNALVAIADLYQLRFLDVSQCVRLSPWGLSQLTVLPVLETLRIRDCPRVKQYWSTFHSLGGPLACDLLVTCFPYTFNRDRSPSESMRMDPDNQWLEAEQMMMNGARGFAFQQNNHGEKCKPWEQCVIC